MRTQRLDRGSNDVLTRQGETLNPAASALLNEVRRVAGELPLFRGVDLDPMGVHGPG